MAYSNNGLLNLLAGTVKNCTFYEMNGQQIARRKAKLINNPRTLNQQLNRDNIRPLLIYFRQLKPLLYVSLNERPENHTTYNHFLSLNLNKSVKKGRFEPGKLVLSSESFQSTQFQVTRHIDSRDNFMIRWDDDSNNDKRSSDKLLVAYFDIQADLFQYSITSVVRSSQEATVSFTLYDPNSPVYLYLFFVRQDYSKSSRLEILEFS